MRHTRSDPAEGPADTGGAFRTELLVRDRMSTPAVTVTTTTALAEAIKLMAFHRIHYLPVVDAQGALTGMVNADDVLGTRTGGRPPGDVIGAVMSAPAVSVGPTVSLADAMRLMAERAIGALPVVQDGRVLGILTQSDVVAAVSNPW